MAVRSVLARFCDYIAKTGSIIATGYLVSYCQQRNQTSDRIERFVMLNVQWKVTRWLYADLHANLTFSECYYIDRTTMDNRFYNEYIKNRYVFM